MIEVCRVYLADRAGRRCTVVRPCGRAAVCFPHTAAACHMMPQEAAPAASDQADEDAQLDPRLQRQVVDYPSREAPGTVIIDTPHTYLYYVLGGGKAMRYGIGVGREGFTWSGVQAMSCARPSGRTGIRRRKWSRASLICRA